MMTPVPMIPAKGAAVAIAVAIVVLLGVAIYAKSQAPANPQGR